MAAKALSGRTKKKVRKTKLRAVRIEVKRFKANMGLF